MTWQILLYFLLSAVCLGAIPLKFPHVPEQLRDTFAKDSMSFKRGVREAFGKKLSQWTEEMTVNEYTINEFLSEGMHDKLIEYLLYDFLANDCEWVDKVWGANVGDWKVSNFKQKEKKKGNFKNASPANYVEKNQVSLMSEKVSNLWAQVEFEWKQWQSDDKTGGGILLSDEMLAKKKVLGQQILQLKKLDKLEQKSGMRSREFTAERAQSKETCRMVDPVTVFGDDLFYYQTTLLQQTLSDKSDKWELLEESISVKRSDVEEDKEEVIESTEDVSSSEDPYEESDDSSGSLEWSELDSAESTAVSDDSVSVSSEEWEVLEEGEETTDQPEESTVDATSDDS
ncbi:hypothetical protein RFI_22092, partial [Reticulomyxa filosa]